MGSEMCIRDSIDQDTTLAIAHVYKQEMYLWMHMKGLYSLGIFKVPPNAVNFHGQNGALQSWRNMPPIVSVTLRVPRSKLSPFISKVTKVGCTPPPHGILESSPRSANQWQHMFAATQIGFGTLKTKGLGSATHSNWKLTKTKWDGQEIRQCSFLSMCLAGFYFKNHASPLSRSLSNTLLQRSRRLGVMLSAT